MFTMLQTAVFAVFTALWERQRQSATSSGLPHALVEEHVAQTHALLILVEGGSDHLQTRGERNGEKNLQRTTFKKRT